MNILTKLNRNLFFAVVSLLCISAICSCGNATQSQNATEIVEPYANMTLDEIINAKDSLYQILSKNDDGFYYVNTTDSLFFFDYINKKDILVFTPDSASNVFKIKVNTLQLDISENGNINVIKKDMGKRSGYADDLFCNLVRRARMASYYDTEHFFGKDGFIIDVEQSIGSYKFDRYYLIKPLGDGYVEAIVLPNGSDCHTNIEFDPFQAYMSFDFDLSQLPAKLRPVFENERVNQTLYDRDTKRLYPSLVFSYGAKLNIDGSIEPNNYVTFGQIDNNIDKNLFKSKEELTSYLIPYQADVISVFNRKIEDFAIEHASPLQYFYDACQNKNEWKRMMGHRYYINAIIDGVSERNSNGLYEIKFADRQINKIVLQDIFGTSSDSKFKTLHLPAQVVIKATVRDGHDYWGGVIFTDLEIIR